MGFGSVLLITSPCMLAIMVSWQTPETGFGCRSFMIFLYWVSQMILIIFVIFIETINNRFVLSVGLVFGILALFVSFLAAIGGTLLQITGVYRNCWCKAGIRSFIHRDSKNYLLELATDTGLDRRMAKTWWRYTGIAGLATVGVICFYAWWYQRNIRQHCSRLIHTLDNLPPPECHLFRLRASMADSWLPYRQFLKVSGMNPHLKLRDSIIIYIMPRLRQSLS